ncbi:uncharacterized protein METZ01_LOCUS454563 [marine metagenome]|uniref:Uncharacterized protein n=1 Tax=marine metagenome TaxID=408172 RepID=A0A383A2A2_9ZZZZ
MDFILFVSKIIYRLSITKMLIGKSCALLIGYFKYTYCASTQTNFIIAERFNQ